MSVDSFTAINVVPLFYGRNSHKKTALPMLGAGGLLWILKVTAVWLCVVPFVPFGTNWLNLKLLNLQAVYLQSASL